MGERTFNPLLMVAGLLIAAGGLVHLREWLDTYRHVSSDVAGSALVRVGFPIDVVISVGLAAALIWCSVRPVRWTNLVVIGSVVFQAGALFTLVQSRTGSVLGWTEHIWTSGANQSRALEIGALVALVAHLVIDVVTDRGARVAPA